MKPFLNLKSVDEVHGLIFALPMLGSEKVKLDEAIGRRIAVAFHALSDLPGFTRSTMDGYAVRSVDTFGATEANPALLHIIGSCKMGLVPNFVLNPGEAASILTGSALPEGADAVVRIEDCRVISTDLLEIIRPVSPYGNIIEKDEDAATGEILIGQGRRLRPQEVGILAAFGCTEVEVYRVPRVAIISTGDEIVPIEVTPGPAELRDVNSWSLDAFCKLHHAEPSRMGLTQDVASQLEARLRSALAQADIVVVSGGSSAGMRDHTVEAFLSLRDARLLVHGVAISPGKPFILAQSGEKILVGLPGHVTSALICAYVFLGPIIDRLQGATHLSPLSWINAILTRSIPSAQGRRDYIRCHLEEEGGRYLVEPLRKSSAVLSSLIEADGLIICPENSEGLVQGQEVRFYPF